MDVLKSDKGWRFNEKVKAWLKNLISISPTISIALPITYTNISAIFQGAVVHQRSGFRGRKLARYIYASSARYADVYYFFVVLYGVLNSWMWTGYTGRVTVPLLVDKKTKTIVNNESAEILRIFSKEFNEFCVTSEQKNIDLRPESLQSKIDGLNDWIAP